jgi:arabinan endo-1,5-alpha-L-arabinosidase
MNRRWTLLACCAGSLAWAAGWTGTAQAQLVGDLRVHDPSRILKLDGQYYVFATGRGVETKHSDDLVRWTEGPPAHAETPEWTRTLVPRSRGRFWAPDVVNVGDKYLLYYSVSTFGSQVSAIGLATNVTLNPDDPGYKWVDQGPVIQSDESSPYNTIDPAALWDDGKLWLAFGSFWGGVYVTELDGATGKRLDPAAPPVHVAKNKTGDDIEAACLHKRGDAYYLFVNWGRCCRGVRSTYNVRVGRGAKPTGPFHDQLGASLAEGGGTLLLDTADRFIGPGHVGVLVDGDAEYVSYHYYDGADRGRSKLTVRRLTWTPEGWPVIAEAE